MSTDTTRTRQTVTNDDADYYKRVAEWERDAAWGGDDDVDTLRELEPTRPAQYRQINMPVSYGDVEVDRGMELTGIMAVFLVGLAIGIVGTVLVML